MGKFFQQFLIVLFVCCFAFQLNAQIHITDYKIKRKHLSNEQKALLDDLFSERLGSLYVDIDGQGKKEDGSKGDAALMVIKSNDDFNILQSAFPSHLNAIAGIEIGWNGHDDIVMPEDFLQIFSSLRYILITSNNPLDIESLKNNLPLFFFNLNASKQIEVLYSGIEQAQ